MKMIKSWRDSIDNHTNQLDTIDNRTNQLEHKSLKDKTIIKVQKGANNDKTQRTRNYKGVL